MSIPLSDLPAVTTIGATDILHLRTAAGNDQKITGANFFKQSALDAEFNDLKIIGTTSTIELKPTSTGDAIIKIGLGRSGSGFSVLDFIGDTTYTSYGLRLVRNNAGANSTSLLTHRGTGALEISTQEAAHFRIYTTNTIRTTILATGLMAIGAHTPTELLHLKSTTASIAALVETTGAFDAALILKTANRAYNIRSDQASSYLIIHDVNAVADRILMDTSGNLAIEAGGLSFDTFTTKMKYKVIDIGDWDMNATTTVTVAHGIGAAFANIRQIRVVIRNDADTTIFFDSDSSTSGGSASDLNMFVDTTNVTLNRVVGSGFDNTLFDSTSYNRGFITIWYTV